ncbi:MAG: 50S ribosomal protein L6 [Myxococcota bacterium]
MSRIGKLPIPVPDKVQVKLDGDTIVVKGPKGELSRPMPPQVTFKIEGNEVVVEASGDRQARAMHGLGRSLIANMVEGVSKGFKRSLEIKGVGYKVEQVGKSAFLRFDLGFSHPIFYELPDGVTATIGRGNILTLESADKEVLGQASATVRSFRPPEPYKGKGIKYTDEVIVRKVGKAGGK